MLKLGLLAVLSTVAMIGTAEAQWLTSKSENPFDGVDMHIAMTAQRGVAFGYRCQSDGKGASLVFIVPDVDADTKTAAAMNLASVKLAVIVDKDARIELDADVDALAGDGSLPSFRLIASGDGVADLAQRMAAAKSRIAVAVSLHGNTFSPTIFGVQGSRRAVEATMGRCGVKPAS